jgi:polygalacturonase
LLDCKNVLLQGYQVTNTPFWQHHPVNCHGVVIRGVHANSLGPNSDGFDPESCTQVLVENCLFDTGDDCIAIKAGKDLDTQLGPTRDVVIQNCTMHSGHGAVTLGSEMSAGIEKVYVQDLLMENSHWQTNPLNTAIRLKTNMNRGGYLRHFYVRRIQLPHGVQTTPSFYSALPGSPLRTQTIASAAGAVVTFDCDYASTKDSVRTRRPKVSDVHISEVQVADVVKEGTQASCYQAFVMLGPVAASFNGSPAGAEVYPIQNVTLSDCDFGHPANTTHPYFLFNAQAVQLKNVQIGEQVLNTVLSA